MKYIHLGLIAMLMPLVALAQAAAGKEETLDPIVIDLAKTSTLSRTMDGLSDERLVYVGEAHTAFEDHLLQLEVLKAMHRQGGKIALGVEWFQWPFQEHLDAYLADKSSEAEMLAKTGYFNRWKFDYRLYRPIIAYAKKHGIPIIALNAPRELTDAISDDGLESIDGPMKAQLPDSYDFSDNRYRERLEQFFKMHPELGKNFKGFLEVQLTWDETMAQKVSDYLIANPDHRMLVLAGNGHIEYRSGIPQRVTRRTGIVGKTFTVSKSAATDRDIADFLLHSESRPLPDAGVFGAFLDDDESQVRIIEFTESSTGKKAGMKENDRIIAINGHAISNYAELKLVMLDKRPGDEINIELERPIENGASEKLSLHVTLGSREKPKHAHER